MRPKESSADVAREWLVRAEVTIDLLLVRTDAALFLEDARGVHHPRPVVPHDGEPVIEALVREAEEHLAVVIKPEDVSLAHVVQDLSCDERQSFEEEIAGICPTKRPDPAVCRARHRMHVWWLVAARKGLFAWR